MSVIGSNILAGASGQGGYFLTNSLRFRSSASAYLNRTPASAGNRRTYTWSGWVKRGSLGASRRNMISAGTWSGGNLISAIAFDDGTADTLYVFCDIYGSGNQWQLRTTQVFRDPSAWYHIVVAVDTTQATSSNRVKIYVNGTQVTAFSTATYPSLNFDNPINNTVVQQIGASTAGEYFDGYMAEVNFIDGQALTPSSFGETSTTTGVWIPKKYSGNYGTNGFYLPFTNTTSTSTLGNDFSGNSNTWTVNNISLTAGTTYDSMTDVPTLTSATTANYAVMNPLANGGTLSGGNLNATSGTNTIIYSTFALQTNKYYWEVTLTNSTTQQIGIADFSKTNTTNVAPGDAGKNGYIYLTNGSIYNNGSQLSSGLSTVTTNDVVGIAYDSATNKLWFNKNGGTWFGGGDPASGTTPTVTTSTSFTYCPVLGSGGGSDAVNVAVNFGQRPFAYTPPTGFVALNTFNLPTPTIGATASTQANDYFNVVTYTGNGSVGRAVTGVGFQPDFTWIKGRSDADYNYLVDIIRTYPNRLFSNLTDAASTESNTVTSSDSDGFTVGSDAGVNRNNSTYVAWNWKANGAGSSNTAGSITSTVSANTSAGFSIATFTGNGTGGATVGHGLGVTPSMVIVKKRSGVADWAVQHISLGANASLRLNGTDATANEPWWNSTTPSSTVFTLGSSNTINQSGETFVAYCFAQVAGYSAFGSYTGNGSSDGTFIFTGFRPKFVMFKRTDSAGDWNIRDTSRSTYNVVGEALYPNLSFAEYSGSETYVDLLSNGIKFRGNWASSNASGATYIYYAVAENPFKYSNAR